MNNKSLRVSTRPRWFWFRQRPRLTLVPHPTGSPTRQPGRLQMLPPRLIVAEGADDGEKLSRADLEDFADHLAKEMEFDRTRAIWEPSLWYQAQVGEDVCTEKQAVKLREMTITRCIHMGRYPSEIEHDFQASAASGGGGDGGGDTKRSWRERCGEWLDILGFFIAMAAILLGFMAGCAFVGHL